MAIFEVTYELNGETHSTLIEASDPVQAAQVFSRDHAEPGTVVLCVVRQ